MIKMTDDRLKMALQMMRKHAEEAAAQAESATDRKAIITKLEMTERIIEFHREISKTDHESEAYATTLNALMDVVVVTLPLIFDLNPDLIVASIKLFCKHLEEKVLHNVDEQKKVMEEFRGKMKSAI